MYDLAHLDNYYHGFSKLEKFILQLLSIMFEPTSKTTIVKCLQEYSQHNDQQSLLNNAAIGSILTKFNKLKLINQDFRVHSDFIEIITRRALKDNNFALMARAIQTVLPLQNHHTPLPYSAERCLRDIRIHLYSQDIVALNRCLELAYKYYAEFFNQHEPLARICNSPWDATWFTTLNIDIQHMALKKILRYAALGLRNIQPIIDFIGSHHTQSNNDSDTSFNYLLLPMLLLQGNTELIENIDSNSAFINFADGDYQQASDKLTTLLCYYRRKMRMKNYTFDDITTLFYCLTLLAREDLPALNELQQYLKATEKKLVTELQPVYQCIQAAVFIKQNQTQQARDILTNIDERTLLPLTNILQTLVLFWLDSTQAKRKVYELEIYLRNANKHHYMWVSILATELLAQLTDKNYQQIFDKLKQQCSMPSILNIINKQPTWQRTLNALESYGNTILQQENKAPTRLAWFFNPKTLELQPREQKLGIKGVWSKGRNIALNRLYKLDEQLDYLTSQDKRICEMINETRDYHYGNNRYSFDMPKTLCELVNHPYLFLLDSMLAIEIVKGDPELIIEKVNAKNYLVKFTIDIPEDDIALIAETPTRYRLFQFNKPIRDIANIIGNDGLTVPLAAKAQILRIINHIASFITIHSAIGGSKTSLATINANSHPYVHLLPMAAGFKLGFYVKPFGAVGPYYKPGVGSNNVIADINGERMQARRDLKEESKLAQQVIDACPALGIINNIADEVLLDTPDNCLQVLFELHNLAEQVTIEWPEGERLKIKHRAHNKQLSLNVSNKNDWFLINGNITLDQHNSLEFTELLKLAQQNSSKFIPLDENQFIALTDDLRKQLDILNRYTEITPDGAKIHPLASATIEGILQQANKLVTDNAWQQQLNHLKQAEQLQVNIPSTLQAQLRDYQQEGFIWLARLAHWNVGACLADDMGLGKTLQALTLILLRAQLGPCLVIAPTSVCMNWIDEAKRYTPTLNIVQMNSKCREETLASLTNFDVLVCSYGLLPLEAEKIAKVNWNTIILDEAQAIKNSTTKRFKAATSLSAKFKLITTGTPLENHLGELWSLFQFINPGLLGSQQSFQRKFITPITKDHDKTARKHLKNLIQPFILRRTKSEVLEELPPRTDINLYVEMNPEETNLYESLRKHALQQLTSNTGAKADKNYIHILAEITKLRRAACHPKLINPTLNINSSKLEVFAETVKELLANQHKVLVFSQFVDYLKLIREYLQQQNISYQYLDGSTPSKQRKQAVDSFQAGKGDLFLISLRAGGFGLNLTAADYVIHMDPWWNPAVEDQASDRAHRIGQQRPVTIYRLIMKDSIEEKILALHQNKRKLADSLLEGTDTAGKLSTKELLQLIQFN